MSLLHPNEDDDAFAAGHADSGHRMALNRIARLTALLKRARVIVSGVAGSTPGNFANVKLLEEDIEHVLQATVYDEQDDGHWRFSADADPPPLKKKR